MIEINLLSEGLKVKAKNKKTVSDIKPAKLLYLIPVLLAVLICTHIGIFATPWTGFTTGRL